MFAIKDLLALLEEWPKWKRVRDAPEALDALSLRVLELEKKLARCPGEACPHCGELEFRVEKSGPAGRYAMVGEFEREKRCQKCGYSESRLVKDR